jgi:hypothetical protein
VLKRTSVLDMWMPARSLAARGSVLWAEAVRGEGCSGVRAENGSNDARSWPDEDRIGGGLVCGLALRSNSDVARLLSPEAGAPTLGAGLAPATRGEGAVVGA